MSRIVKTKLTYPWTTVPLCDRYSHTKIPFRTANVAGEETLYALNIIRLTKADCAEIGRLFPNVSTAEVKHYI